MGGFSSVRREKLGEKGKTNSTNNEPYQIRDIERIEFLQLADSDHSNPEVS